MSSRRGIGEGSVYRRASDGLWVASIHLGYRDGSRTRKCAYARTRKAAEAKLLEMRQHRTRGIEPPPGRMTVANLLHEWLQDRVRTTVRPKTYTSYEQIARVHLIPYLGAIRLSILTPGQVQSYLTDCSSRGLSPRTVRYHREVLRNALNWALRSDLVGRNAAALTEGPHVPRREGSALDPAEAAAFIASLDGHRHRTLFVLALATGLRQGEALGLRWDDIDLDSGRVTVRHALQRIEGRLTLVPPKSLTSRRTVPVPPSVASDMRRHRASQLRDRLLAGDRWHDTGFVFTTSVGTPLDGPTVTRQLKSALRAAGLPERRFHDLRHSYASFLISGEVPIRVAMELLGHSDVRLTLNTYSHVYPGLKAVAAARVEELLGAAVGADAADGRNGDGLHRGYNGVETGGSEAGTRQGHRS